MLYKTQNYWAFGLCPPSGILKNTTFRKLDVFPPVTEVSSLQRIQQSKCLPPPHLKTETDLVSETLCSVEYWTTSKLKTLSNPVCLHFTLLLPAPKSPKAVISFQVFILSSLPRLLHVPAIFLDCFSRNNIW
jgi:hypothetical protein